MATDNWANFQNDPLPENINSGDEFGITALMVAARVGNYDLADKLLHSAADPNVTDCEGSAALHRSIRYNHYPITRLLIDAGADHSLKDEYGCSPFLLSAMVGDQRSMRYMLANGAQINQYDAEYRTALIWAAIRNHLPIIHDLIKQPILIDFQSDSGRTALMEAAFRGHLEIVDLLLCCHASADIRANDDSMALHFALRKKQEDCALKLIDKSFDFNRQNKNGFTPLIIAARNGLSHAGCRLLEKGADPEINDPEGFNALYWARKRNHVTLIHYLKSHMTMSAS